MKDFDKMNDNSYYKTPRGTVKMSPYGLVIPQWLRKDIQEKGYVSVRLKYDKNDTIILIQPVFDGPIIEKRHCVKLVKKLDLNVPILCPCKWKEDFKAWTVDIGKGK